MRLPKDILSNTYTKPRIFLCESDKTKICPLETTNTHGSFKFNSYSEISFDTSRVYNDTLTGKTKVNPFYDKIEALRLIEIENIGYFEIQGPELTSDGIQELKSITAYSLEYTLSQKYLEDFYINTGQVNSVEVMEAEDAGTPNNIIPVTLYNPQRPELSLLHLILEKVYGWSIGHVDTSLQTLSRSFEVDRESVYDFIINEICEKFNCYVVFDTINNTINLYAESLTSKFVGDGVTNTFILSPPFDKIGTVSVDGYKTTRWEYNSNTGEITLEDIPENGTHIEIIDGALSEWETDVFVTFDNLSQEINIDYDADSIKTVLTVTYGEDENIREANLGLPYIVDLSYYYSVDWMGQDLYDAYTKYLQKTNAYQSSYTNNNQEMLDIAGRIDFEENRLSLQYSIAQSVHSTTVGTYYVRGGTAPNYYYTEVSLPADYDANVTYYSMDTTNLSEEKVSNLYEALKSFFNANDEWEDKFDELQRDFEFMESPSLSDLVTGLKTAESDSDQDVVVLEFLDTMWDELGKIPLQQMYYEPYKTIQITNIEAGWAEAKSSNYGLYYPVTLFLDSLENSIAKREATIEGYEIQYGELQKQNSNIGNDLLIANNFTDDQLIRLNAFLREDELQLDDIVETDLDTIADSFKIKQDAMESGRIELNKLCQPQLKFSMSMANIYALPEFEPIVGQFQLGNVIKVGLRDDYIKQSRLLQVDINFDDFSDFACEFGDLTSLRTQSDIHADLLKNAVSAGKQVATSGSYWTKGADQASKIDLKIQQGLIDAATQIKAIDGTQDVSVDKYGIHLRKKNGDGGYDDKQGWIINNQFLYSDDAFKTVKAVFGEYTVDNEKYWGLLAEAVIAGYIEGSKIKGGTIQIGEYDNEPGRFAFEVDEKGNVSMLGGAVQFTETENSISRVQQEFHLVAKDLETQITEIADKNMYDIEIIADGPTIMTDSMDSTTLTCIVYSWDTDITNTLDDSIFNWIRTSNNAEQDAIWNAMPEHRGVKSIIINVDDIFENASFSCEVDLPE